MSFAKAEAEAFMGAEAETRLPREAEPGGEKPELSSVADHGTAASPAWHELAIPLCPEHWRYKQ